MPGGGAARLGSGATWKACGRSLPAKQHLLGHQHAFLGGMKQLFHAADRFRLRHGCLHRNSAAAAACARDLTCTAQGPQFPIPSAITFINDTP